MLAEILLLTTACEPMNSDVLELNSPDDKVKIQFCLSKKGQPRYTVSYSDYPVIDTSHLGFSLNAAPDLIEGFKIVRSEATSFDQTWEQPWGEQQQIRNHYNQLHIQLEETNEPNRRLDIVFRVYNDGVGFRYEFPEQDNLSEIEILEEHSQFNMARNFDAWYIPGDQPNRYEYLYKKEPLSKMGTVHTPVTFESPDDNLYISIHEAALTDYTSMRVSVEKDKTLVTDLVPYSDEVETRAYITLPAHTPWRTIQLAEKPGDLITSYLILNLNEPNKLGDVSWFKPGKYVGIWWEIHIGKGSWNSGPQHAANTANTKKYIDFASEHGFDGVLVEGWNKGWDGNWMANGEVFSFTEPYPDYDIQELGRYAKERGVYLVGHHETSGNIDNYESQMNAAYQLLEDIGSKAVKTGYVEHGNKLSNGKYHHGQAYIKHFQDVLKKAAEHQVAVAAHEPIKSTGERRTYPNLIGTEGARGQEYNAWAEDGGNPPEHTTILPFTRCLGGPMDFTPGVFDITIPSKPDNQVNTTLVKQLALYVTMYSPMHMACDMPENYMKYPDAFQFIKDVGVDWETTIIPDARIGDFLVTARKEKGTGNWFVGAITDEEEREVNIDLDFLEEGVLYKGTIYRDGDDAHYKNNPESYIIESGNYKKGDIISAKLAAGGGFAMSLMK